MLLFTELPRSVLAQGMIGNRSMNDFCGNHILMSSKYNVPMNKKTRIKNCCEDLYDFLDREENALGEWKAQEGNNFKNCVL